MKEGTLWGQKQFSEKKSQCAEKNQSGALLGTSGCICFLEKVKIEKDPLD